MTKNAASDPTPDGVEREADGVVVSDTVTVRERLVQRTCSWCHAPIEYTGVGRPPLYCRPSHRKRASELRRAQDRAGRPVTEGGRTSEPVREVVERVETVTRTVIRQEIQRVPAVRLSGEPYTLPADAIEWAQALAHLRTEVAAGRIPVFIREALARACDLTARALRNDPPSPEDDAA